MVGLKSTIDLGTDEEIIRNQHVNLEHYELFGFINVFLYFLSPFFGLG